MNLHFTKETSKEEVFNSVKNYLESKGFSIVNFDASRPWGGFFVIDELQAKKFIEEFFSNSAINEKFDKGKISPKILIVESDKRLSWQYHHRRAEKWVVIGGKVGIKVSDNDTEGALQTKKVGDKIILRQGERHRLIGLSSWGIIAEIWQHTDEDNPSDEEDIVRVQDDFGR
ncbi:MAG: phosphoheptose isomerase [Bacteroidota bacterium]|nr:phosphoheptose isomerase [Bacteroidota bacterium]